MRFPFLASTLVFASTAIASYNDITTLGFDVCIPTTVQVTVTTTISYVAGAKDTKSKYSKGNGYATGAGYGDAGALTLAGKKGYGGGTWDDEDDAFVHSTTGLYAPGGHDGYAHEKPLTSARTYSKSYSIGQYDDEIDAIASKKGYGFGNHGDSEDDSNASRGSYLQSSSKGGYGGAYSPIPAPSSRKSYPGQSDHKDVDPASSAYPSLHWSRYSNSTTSDSGFRSSSATRSSLSLIANSQSSKSSSSGAASSNSGSASSSAKSSSFTSTAMLSFFSSAPLNGTSSVVSSSIILSSSSSASALSISSSAAQSSSSSDVVSSSSLTSSVLESSASVDLSSSSARLSESSLSSSTISKSSLSSEASSTTSSDVSSSTISESSSSTTSESSSITSSDASSITSATTFSSESSAILSSATSSVSQAVCVPDESSTCQKSSDCCNAGSGSRCRQGTCRPCLPHRNYLENNGFASGTLAGWTSIARGARPIEDGVTDFRHSDGDGYSFGAKWQNRGTTAGSMALRQNFAMPSGTTVSVGAFVRQQGEFSGAKFSMKIDGVVVIELEITNEIIWLPFGPKLVPLTGDDHVLEMVMEPRGGSSLTAQHLLVDGLAVTANVAPPTHGLCDVPDPDPVPEPQLPCIKVGDRIINGGFSDGTIAPFAKDIASIRPIVEGVVTDPSGSADNDARYYKAVFNPSGEVQSVTLTQTGINLPSGTKVLCLARVKHDRTDDLTSTFMLLINGQQCGPALQHGDAGGADWVEVDGVATLTGDTHTLSLVATPNAFAGTKDISLFIDNIELVPLELPAGRSFCSEPPVTCRNDGTFGCTTNSDCCTADRGSTCLSNVCTPCFTPSVNVLFNPSFGSGQLAPWTWTTNRAGDMADHTPNIASRAIDADGRSLYLSYVAAGSVFLEHAIALPAGSVVECGAVVMDVGEEAAYRYKLSVGSQTCAERGQKTSGAWRGLLGTITLTEPATRFTLEVFSSEDDYEGAQWVDAVSLRLLSSPNSAPLCAAAGPGDR